jgi:hypothetical protein
MTDSVATTGDYEEYQIPLPASFQALYADARGRLQAPLSEVRIRYEWCEDLAQLLAERVGIQPQDGWQDQQRLLAQCRNGLGEGGEGGEGGANPAAQTAGEVDWIVRRLAELLGWGSSQASTLEN